MRGLLPSEPTWSGQLRVLHVAVPCVHHHELALGPRDHAQGLPRPLEHHADGCPSPRERVNLTLMLVCHNNVTLQIRGHTQQAAKAMARQAPREPSGSQALQNS